jgi:hypothetical protein
LRVAYHKLHYPSGKAVPYFRQLVAILPPRRPGFEPRSGHVGFVVDKVALGQVFSEYFGFPANSIALRIEEISKNM